MHGNAATGWALLGAALGGALLLVFGLYMWDTSARSAEASLRPQPVAPLAAAPPTVTSLGLVGASPQAATQPTASGDVAAGQTLFQSACNACHPAARAGIGPALYGTAFTERYPDNAAVASVIRSGRGGMPAFGPDRLSESDLANVIAYLRSLSAAPQAAAPTSSAPVAVSPTTTSAAGPVATPTPLSQQVLSSLSPGLSSYMLETAKRMGRAWFAGQAGNWDEAAFEIREARGVLQAGAARSNASRQQALQAFNNGFMTPLTDASQSGDATQFQQAYRNAIQACNACHAGQTYGATNKPFSFIQVQVPTNSIWDVYANGTSGASAAEAPSTPSAVASASPTPLTASQLTSMTPGLSTFMMEAAKRMGRSWFAAQTNNWDEAAFEVREARGVLQAGALRSPGNQARAQAITAFNDGFFGPLIQTAQAGDQAAYQAAYRNAIAGCNACHASQTYGAINQPFSFIRVQVPTHSIWDVYAYAK